MTQPAPTSVTTEPSRLPFAHNETRNRYLAVELETAASFWGRFKGLMGRHQLRRGGGLWLPATNGIHMFFMRFPIDAVFLGRARADGLREVLSVHRSLRPWTGMVPLVRGADGVLELPAGMVDETATAPGDTVRFG